MQDLEYYEEKIGLPEMGFSPDAEFPLINTEKGIVQMKLNGEIADERLISIACGTRPNVVPGTAVAVLAGDWREQAADAFEVEDEDCSIETELVDGNTKIVVTGVPAHASMPDHGKNSAKMLIAVLEKLGIGGAPISLLHEAAGEGAYGVNMGIAGADAVSGPLTINLGLLFVENGKISVTFDCRYPVFFDDKTVTGTVAKRLAPAGFVMEPCHASHPHHVPESSELVTKLMAVYNGITGTQSKPFAIGGGTYARHLKEGVAFGMMFPGEPELAHQANENIDVANYVKAARIYAYAIVALCA
jgi:succinyl-diaminopimelate desuccinylase